MAKKESIRNTGVFAKKHTLDSDEEDDILPHNSLMDADIEGQEEATIDIEEGIRFTPFNMKDELEEGHFDADGMYIFKRSKDKIYDQWIDDVNWSDVKHMEKAAGLKKDVQSDHDDDTKFDESLIYNEMLAVMKPGESVLNAIKRLGKESKNLETRTWKTKRVKKDIDDNNECNKDSASLQSCSTDATKNCNTDEKNKLLALIGCADKLLLNGYVTVYQDTFEKLLFKLNTLRKTEEKHLNCAVDAEFDIFNDDTEHSCNPSKIELSNASKSTTQCESAETDNVSWEFKWQNERDSDIHGPFTSLQMQQWADEDYFEDGVYVRKCGSDGKFYSSKRMDFNLYF